MSEKTKVYILSSDYRQVIFNCAGGKAREYSEYIGVYTSIDQILNKLKQILNSESYKGFVEFEVNDEYHVCIKAYQRLDSNRGGIEYLYFDVTEFYLNE